MAEENHYPAAFNRLVKSIVRLPGIGARTAERLALALYEWPDEELKFFADQIAQFKDLIVTCGQCGNFSEQNLCNICADSSRDKKIVCLVETISQIPVVEKSGSFHGLYHVLGGRLSPVNGIGPEKLNINSLLNRLADVEEIIIATNSDFDGEATATYIVNLLKDSPVHITRLARGIPVGADISFADSASMAAAIHSRKKI